MAGTCCPCCWGQRSTQTMSSCCITVRIHCTRSAGTNGTVSNLGDRVISWLQLPWLCITLALFSLSWHYLPLTPATSFLMQAVNLLITILPLLRGFSYGFPVRECSGLPLTLKACALNRHWFPPAPISTTLTQ